MPRRTQKQLLIDQLLQAGYDPRNLADALAVPISDVLAASSAPIEHAGSMDTEELRGATRALAYRAIEKADHILEYGAPNQQMSLINALLKPMLYAARDTSDVEKKYDDLRVRFAEFMEDVRSVDEPDEAGRRAVDPDEGRAGAELEPELGAAEILARGGEAAAG